MNYRSILAATAGVIGMVAGRQSRLPLRTGAMSNSTNRAMDGTVSVRCRHYNDGYYAYGSAVVVHKDVTTGVVRMTGTLRHLVVPTFESGIIIAR